MADLVYKIGADVTDLEKGVAKAESALKDVGGTINKTVTPAINTSTQALQSFDKTIKQTSSELNTIKPAAVNGANALNSIGQVTRDLPFGFIAIQNNLPQVVDSFGALAKQSGGALPALKALGASLAGPAGIAFAFGAVTAGVTSLIQKYGSLGEAFNVILGITKPLTEGQIAYNKALYEAAGGAAAEEAKISILTKTLLNNQKPQSDRISAYNELNKVAPELVAGIKEENALTTQSSILIQANAETRKRSIQLKIQEAGINAVLQTNETKLAELRQKLTLADQEYVKSAANLNKAQKQGLVTGFASQTQQQAALTDFNNSANAVTNLRNQINALTKEQDGYLNQLDPVINGIAEINTETNKRIKAAQEQEKAEKKTAAELERAAKAAKNYKYELQSLSEFKLNPEQLDVKNQIERLQELANVVLNVKASEEKRLAALKELQSIEPALFKGLDLQSKNYDKLKASIDVTNEGYLLQLNYLNSIAKASDKIQPQKAIANITPTAAAPITAPTALPAAIDEFLAKQNQAKDALIDFRKQANLSAAYNLLNDTFFSPIQDLFSNFLETGKFAMADFGKAVLKAINQIVAKIVATGIIALLFTLFTGGFGAAAGGAAGGFKQVLGAIGGSLGFSGGKVAAPSFAGIGGGSLGMSGQVNVVLRGSDLVGSINRTNATINRVG
jgi:hypothetical protein